MNKVVHFEIPYANADRANHFYEHIFGWKIVDSSMGDMEYYIAHTGPTDEKNMAKEVGFINGGLMPKNEMVKSPVIAMMVDDINESLKMIEEHGGKKMMEPVKIGDMGHYAYAEDTEGNIIGVWQNLKKT